MFSTNDFDKGYQDGLSQARKGDKKNYFNFDKLKTFFSSNALDTYMDGVNQGYLDGLREKHLVHKTDIAERRNSMNPIIINQVETLRNLKAFLIQFNEALNTGSEHYQQFLDDLADQQLDAQIYNRYQAEFLDETKARIHNIVSNIEENDIPYIERLVAHVEETLMVR